MKYSDIDPRKTAFIFELDNVLYPEKDYLFQVYYLFANFIEYIEFFEAGPMISLMIKTYEIEGKDLVFDRLQQKFKLDEKYRFNFNHLMKTAKLPLKLLLYPNMLAFLQDVVVDRKKIFIVTNDDPEQQLNKIKQTDWQGLEPYLTCYFAEEIAAKPEPDIVHLLLNDHHLQRRDIAMIANSDTDKFCAEACGIDYMPVSAFL